MDIKTGKIEVQLNKKTTLLKVINTEANAVAFEMTQPISFTEKEVTLTLKENPQEYFL